MVHWFACVFQIAVTLDVVAAVAQVAYNFFSPIGVVDIVGKEQQAGGAEATSTKKAFHSDWN